MNVKKIFSLLLFLVSCSSTPQTDNLSYSRIPIEEFVIPSEHYLVDVPVVETDASMFSRTLFSSDTGELIAPLRTNQSAPFNGVLFNGPAIARIQVAFSGQQERCLIERRSDLQMLSARAIADLQTEQNLYLSNQQRYEVMLTNRENEIQRLSNVTHYNPWLMTGIGVLTGLSLFGLTYAIVH